MQKINFLPQVKLWNAAEFASRPIWDTSLVGGNLTYDANANRFAVTLLNDKTQNPEWRYLLTTDSSVDNGVTGIRLYNGPTAFVDKFAGDNGLIEVLVGSPYSEGGEPNPLATMADVKAAFEGASILGLNMDSSHIHSDSSFLHLKSDSSNPYFDGGDEPGSKVNPLATVATVEAVKTELNNAISDISNAISSLGDLFKLEAIYDASFIEQHPTITNFGELLNYLREQTPNPLTDYERGSVLIFGDEEWVLIDDSNPASANSWELLGTIGAPDAYVTSFGGQTGAITLSNSFFMNGKQLNLETASDTSLGGVMTGHSTGLENSNYIFDLKVGGKAVSDVSRGYVSIPIVTGAATDASYGLVPNAALSGSTHIYTITLDPSTLSNVGVAYNQIKSVKITHTLGTADLVISVYKVRAGSAERNGRQLVYVDEIISGPTSILVDFGSAEAFIGCQDRLNNNGNYLGYVVVIAASTSAVDLNGDAGTSFTANAEAESD